jgi:hypothetical protein
MLEPTTPESIDVKALWRDQPDEKLPVTSPEVLTLRSRRLYAITRSEILTALSATLFFAIVLVLRFGFDKMVAAGLALVTVWGVITLYCLRRRVWSVRNDAFAASGVEFYRCELEQRRKHLMNAWLWHGPLLLACIALAGVAIGTGTLAYKRLPQVSPLLIALVVWSGFSIRLRRREAKAIKRELDEMADPGRHAQE